MFHNSVSFEERSLQLKQIEDSNTQTRDYVSILNDFTKSATIECFENCAKLKSFDLIYTELKGEFLNNMSQYLPHLKVIRLETECLLSDMTFNSLSEFKNLQNLELFAANFTIGNSVCALIHWFSSFFSATHLSIEKNVATSNEMTLKKHFID